MGMNLKEIEREISRLAVEDRARLMERLIQSLDTGEDVDSEGAWLDEAERRYGDYKAGKLSSKSADTVFDEAKSKLK